MSARVHFTRWERDRLGRMVLRQAEYRVVSRPYVVERGLALRDAALGTLACAGLGAILALVFVLTVAP
jgi:hypothetical protein